MESEIVSIKQEIPPQALLSQELPQQDKLAKYREQVRRENAEPRGRMSETAAAKLRAINEKAKLDAAAEKKFAQEFALMCLILWQLGIAVLFYFYDFLMRSPIDENVWSVAMLRSFIVVAENEGLLLPCAKVHSGEQNLECPEFVLRFSMPRAPAEDVSDFGLYTRFRPAHWLACPL